MNKCVKNLLLKLLKKRFMKPARGLLSFRDRCKFTNKIKKRTKIRKAFDNLIIIMATPCHGNLGDHAIVYAEYDLLKKFGYRENVIEISNNDYKKYKTLIKKYICEKDIIIVDGGGNLGTLWPQEDDKISEIIESYKNNKIIVFPQTCYYDNSEDAKVRLKRNQEIYKSAKNLTITLRDRKSYEFCRENFENVDFRLLPDVVLTLSYNKEYERNDKCLICLREDIEKVVTETEKDSIYEELKVHNINYEKISTIYPSALNRFDRNTRLYEIWNKISKSKLVITDRLHGMIFAAITGTPCLALDNESKKVSGVYEWILKFEYIKVCSSTEEMISLIPTFYNLDQQKYESLIFSKEFDQIRCLLD